MTNDLDYVVHMLADMHLPTVAEKTGLAYLTVWKIATGRTATPSYATVRKLSEYLRERAKGVQPEQAG